ncbi:hypothetical protein WJX72_010770 [[Myrmecia] bisecta]|uniref:Bacteriophage/plasmid primase P4 C-terminal domain-containing protein n=1 Tax=[Myrmecia] bisecta TaxID=41462 RepID=A0AAW1QSR0_9CHLO
MAYIALRDTVELVTPGHKRSYYVFDAAECFWRACTDSSVKLAISAALEASLTPIQARYVRGNSGLSAIIALAAERFLDCDFVNRLDSVRHLLGVRNGVVDLRTGVVRARQPEDMIRTVLNIDYNSDADLTFIEATVLQMMADDAVMAQYLQNLLRELNVGLMCGRVVSNIDADRAKIQGAHLVCFNELKEAEKMNNHTMKAISGGDDIPCRGLYQDAMSIVPYHLAICTTNELPAFVTPPKPSEVERVICIPFEVLFTDLAEDELPTRTKKQRDSDLKVKLVQNKASFLSWLVQGAVAWYAAKDLRRAAPTKVKKCTKRYMSAQDKLASFISTDCDLGEAYRVSCADLLSEFQSFLGDPKVGVREVKKQMEEKKYETYVTTVAGRSVRCWRGLKLKTGDDVVGAALRA